jgi:rhodanese-related sulfurtransferase
MTNTISPRELQHRYASGQPVELLDVRTPVEFREVHVKYARNEPLDRLAPSRIQAQRQAAGKPLYVICRSGNRAQQACEKLVAAGIANVVNVAGGTLGCEAEGLPLVRGKPAVSLERQVRIVAGALVLAGAALGIWVHPAWIGLSAFVGAGLMFAGLTDTCGMALLLARMPWNQVPPSTGSGGPACRTG